MDSHGACGPRLTAFYDQGRSNTGHCPVCMYVLTQSNSTYPARLTNGTLVIMEQWCQEIRRHVPGLFAWLKNLTHHRHVCTSSLRVMKYHGSTRAKDGHSFSDYDLVLSTYGTVSREFASGNSQLYAAQWFRLVLDEGEQLNSDLTVGLLTNPS
jgi:SNF2 family DNA or RNA helicase